MPHIQVNDVKIFYVEQGVGEETIIFSHGLLWSQKMFEAQIDFLSTRFRLIAFDHRGQGQSEVQSPFDMDTLTEDAYALIKSLCDGPVHFVGLSMGGFVGMRLAARYPQWIKTLILIETSANAEPIENISKYKTLNKIIRWFGVVGVVADQVMPIMFAESWLQDPLNHRKIQYWRDQMKQNKKSITGPVASVIRRKGMKDELKNITCPTMIIVGDEDVAAKPEEAKFIQMNIPGSILHRIPGAGHSSCIEKPREINRLIGDWLVDRS